MPWRTSRERWHATEIRAPAEDRHHSFCRQAAHPLLLPAECCAQISNCRLALLHLRESRRLHLPGLLHVIEVLLRLDRARLTTERRSIAPCRPRRVPIARLSPSARENCDYFRRTPASPGL